MLVTGSTIVQGHLTLAGVKGDLAKALVGMTWSDAALTLAQVINLAGINEAIKRGAIATYSINGRNVSASLSVLNAAAELCNRMAKLGGTRGPVSLGIEL